MPAPAHRTWPDLAVAFLLAGLLTLAWAWRDWADLSALRLPDTDDMVRLQQIRDWLGGQAFGDLAQHRLGLAPGIEMHWSRLPDFVPAALIALLSPLLGAHAAELAAVIAWPALLFFAALALVANLARALGTSGPLAVVIAALAYPATTLFVPGRIDHHGLQMVLLLVVVRAAIGRGSLALGAGAGIASAASLAVGVETAPLLAIGGSAIVAAWIWLGREALPRLAGYAAALVLTLATGAALLRTGGWGYPACDGFTAELWRGAQAAALAPYGLALFGFAFPGRRMRAAGSLVAAAAAVGSVLLLAPGCLRPYGAVDPLLAKLWLGHVAEAQPLFGAPLAHAIGYAGLMLAGLAATLWLWRPARDPRWLALAAFQLAAAAITLAQLRGAYAGALLAASPLAALITSARARGVALLVPAWLVSAGLLYPLIGNAVAPPPASGAAIDCTSPAALARLAAMPPGRLIAPIDFGAYVLAATPHRAIAAPYHRNGAGNAAMYRFFLGPADAAQEAATKLKLDYVALCPGDFSELDAAAGRPGSLLAALRHGNAPAWLRPISAPGEAPMLFAVATPEPRR